MTDTERRAAVARFVKDWTGRGDEKQETQRFWIELLTKVYGVDGSTVTSFEVPVNVDDTKTGKTTTKFIDAYLPATRVLIEQKGADIDLQKGYKQSDGSLLSPYQQARRYGGYLPAGQQPHWIVVCNFREFRIHDMRRPNNDQISVFECIEKISDVCQKDDPSATAYKIDKILWLVCAGHFYLYDIRIGRHKQELIDRINEAFSKEMS